MSISENNSVSEVEREEFDTAMEERGCEIFQAEILKILPECFKKGRDGNTGFRTIPMPKGTRHKQEWRNAYRQTVQLSQLMDKAMTYGEDFHLIIKLPYRDIVLSQDLSCYMVKHEVTAGLIAHGWSVEFK